MSMNRALTLAASGSHSDGEIFHHYLREEPASGEILERLFLPSGLE